MDNKEKQDKVVTISDLGNSDNNAFEEENAQYAGEDVKVFLL